MPRPRNSIAFGPHEDKENLERDYSSRKRSKSLNSADDITLPLVRKRRTRVASRIPTAPRGILKSSFPASDDNHTVVGVMQVALKEECIAESNPSTSRNLSRRVSFAPEATLHTFELEREDTQSSSATSATAGSTPRSERFESPTLAASARSPLANLRLYNEPSPASPHYAGGSIPLKRSSAVVMTPPRGPNSSATFDDDDEDEDEVEMEDVTDVFDDVFDANRNLFQQQSQAQPVQSSVAVPSSFFSPLTSRARSASSPNLADMDDVGNNGMSTEAMDITTAIGSIQKPNETVGNDDDDEATMDVTRAVGFIEEETGERTMEITRQVGNIQDLSINGEEEGEDHKSMAMDVTQTVGSLQEVLSHHDGDGTEYTSITMDVTNAIGAIQSVHQEGDDTGDSSMAMDFTSAVGTIKIASGDDEDRGNEESPMEVTQVYSSASDGGIVSTRCVLSETRLPASPSTTPNFMEAKQSQPEELVASTKSPKLSSTPLSTRGLRRTPSIGSGSGTETPTRLSHLQLLQFGAAKIVATPISSPRSAAVLRRRRSLLEGDVNMPVFDGRRLSIGTPESQKLKSDITQTLFSVSTSSLQKRIQSLTPKKAVRTPMKPPASSARKRAIESMKSEEQEALSKIYSPLKAAAVTSPTRSTKKKSIKLLSDVPAPIMMKLEQLTNTGSETPLCSHSPVVEPQKEYSYLPISLNEFLRMISIQFLEGLNTKRRNTTFRQPSEAISEPNFRITVLSRQLHCPMLELFEYSCRELRKNIEEGKELFDRLESSIMDDNPEIFCRYVSSTLDSQAAFCAQFKIIKSYARLQSKGVWYKWRSKLLDGVMNTLTKNTASLNDDCTKLKYIEEKVQSAFSDIKSRHSTLKSRLEQLRKRKSEVAECNQEELQSARHNLSRIELDVERKMSTKRQLVNENMDLSISLNARSSDITARNESITMSEKIIKKHEAFDTVAIMATKDELELICKLFGWAIQNFGQESLVLCLDNELEIEVVVGNRCVSRISTTTTGSSPVTEFFIKLLSRDLNDRQLSQLLRDFSWIWHQKNHVRREIELMASHYVTEIQADNSTLTLKPEIFIKEARTKLQLEYRLTADMTAPCPSIQCETKANVVYGKVDETELSKRLRCKLDVWEPGILRQYCDEISLCV
ncbi:Spc7 kinetochore protein-domain-containing protein [Lipomyces tetrasporus]|uniref:Spc7 kinetochore protein-domain-containing protein n=1 Tax=Lipomyces tetrasporus TaxID=54092 RepID=A0AAD7QRW2_9ASCO|nr:Spc7 kinetochore protein-domain-containing protein [Lipomyces tetrasporus]KAJ8100384.1 Spc7 kinetochore protein-domain-containing protein [Lipomyces tetrasporus]